jgi:hypothetical protein
MPATSSTNASRFTAGRVKRLLQTNDEVGHMAASVPVLVGHAAEHFLRDLSLKAAAYARQMGAVTITASLLRYTVEHEERFHFLRPLFGQVPVITDLASASAGQPQGRKRRKLTRTKPRTKRKASLDQETSTRRRPRVVKAATSAAEQLPEASDPGAPQALSLEHETQHNGAQTVTSPDSTPEEVVPAPQKTPSVNSVVAPEARQILDEDYDE